MQCVVIVWMYLAATNRVLVTLLVELKADVHDLAAQMNTVIQTLQSSSATGSELELDDLPVELPVKTAEDLLHLEEELAERGLQKNVVSTCYFLVYKVLFKLTV